MLAPITSTDGSGKVVLPSRQRVWGSSETGHCVRIEKCKTPITLSICDGQCRQNQQLAFVKECGRLDIFSVIP